MDQSLVLRQLVKEASRRHVPNPGSAIVVEVPVAGAGGQIAAMGAEGEDIDIARMSAQSRMGIQILQIPKPDPTIPVAGNKDLPAGSNANASDRAWPAKRWISS